MIIDMKQVTLFVTNSNREEALEKLRELGVLHIKNITSPVSEDVTELENKIRRTENALQVLAEQNGESETPKTAKKSDDLIHETLNLADKRTELEEQLAEKKQTLEWYDTWGKINQKDIKELERRGVYVRLYAASKSYLKEQTKDLPLYKINETKTTAFLALITGDPEEKLDLKEVTVPEKSFAKIRQKTEKIQDEIATVNSKLQNICAETEKIEKYKNKLEKELEFVRVRSGMGEAEEINFLQGFCPVNKLETLREKAGVEGWGYVIREPEEPREVPTQLSDSLTTWLVDPIYRFMGTLPGYQEFDVSLLFLIFFAIFVAMIVGDAGYGLIYLGLTYFAHQKFENVRGETFLLFYILSGATIAWGLASGTFFGIKEIQQFGWTDFFVVEYLNSFPEYNDKVQNNRNLLMFITFVVGAIQLALGHLLQLWRNRKKLNALAQIGWMAIVGAMLFVAEKIVLSGELVGQVVNYNQIIWTVAGGAVLVLFFENYQQGEFWLGIGRTIGNLPMDIISAFSDIVSYIRLFAVGLATVVIETSFNSMAVGDGITGVTDFLVAAIILLLGHSLNIILCVMSIVVHGIRLNMLEFSNHLGMQWTGSRYKPFKK